MSNFRGFLRFLENIALGLDSNLEGFSSDMLKKPSNFFYHQPGVDLENLKISDHQLKEPLNFEPKVEGFQGSRPILITLV